MPDRPNRAKHSPDASISQEHHRHSDGATGADSTHLLITLETVSGAAPRRSVFDNESALVF